MITTELVLEPPETDPLEYAQEQDEDIARSLFGLSKGQLLLFKTSCVNLLIVDTSQEHVICSRLVLFFFLLARHLREHMYLLRGVDQNENQGHQNVLQVPQNVPL